VVTLLIGCVSGPPATEEDMIRTYTHDYDKLFDTARNTLFDLNCKIVEAGNTDIAGVVRKGTQRVQTYKPSKFEKEMGFKSIYMEVDIYTHYEFVFLKSGGETTIQSSIYTSQIGPGGTIIITGPETFEKTMAPKPEYDKYWQLFEKNLEQ
jgi:hypothetical protein